jgi:Spy/CpxP family protein refolding chaperone
MLNQNRLFELALKGLEAERLRLDQEMTMIRRQLKGNAAPATVRAAGRSQNQRTAAKLQSRPASRLTPAGRKKLSDLMKKRWAERRKAAAKKK